ncbi:flagellar hook-associated protein FlgK [Pseudomonas sp. NW5]|uniref:flagellar hook-associated protein FlgK n=1 Tax=Pseudomonas sp. NW5 TaxID=2934934 RepID=UPI0020221DDA|nr:flagellar hook-associated protein FlgK [Pseudomonas sp. NW5]MCL7462243.1 flagellar hook-associated protein FlgK [Pseudomonas sp. NW5]
MSIFSIGVSGMNTAQRALAATSNNIANVYTPGYNREVPLLSENRSGPGVNAAAVERQFDRFIATQLNSSISTSSGLETYAQQINQLDNLLADRDAGLAPMMQNFFASVQKLVAAPSDPAARQGVLGTADTLTAQFRAFDNYLQSMRTSIDGQIETGVQQINTLAEQLAGINRDISLARAKTNAEPNTLLNQRDQLVTDLSRLIDVRVIEQDGASYNVTIGNGIALVAGSDSFKLQAMPAAADPTRTVVGYRDGSGNLFELRESNFRGGELGGVLAFRSETLDKVQNQLGQIAVSLAVGFNEQHQQGFDANGLPGQAMFKLADPQVPVFGNARNTGTATLSATFDTAKIDQLSSADYEIRYSGGEYTVTRLDTGVASKVMPDAEGTLSFGGLNVTVAGTLGEGDRFQLQPLRRAAGSISNIITNPGKLAADGGSLDESTGLLQPTGPGNNANALKLLNLQSSKLVGGSASLSDAYAGIVGDVGNRTAVVEVNLTSQQGLSTQLKALQQSESGVNLDEEGANLMRYQRYYQANAKVIEIGSSILDTLLNLR